MEARCVHSPTFTSIPSTGFLEKTPFLPAHSSIKLPARRIDCPVSGHLHFHARRSGPIKIKSSVTQEASAGSKDANLAFVAGATGRVGSRTVRELLKLGFRVRAGVRSAQRAESLVQSVRDMKFEGAGGVQPIDMLELVECDLEQPDTIQPALGNSSVVICSIGASEKEVFDVTGPYRIDYLATKNLINAATSAKVDHFILVTSLGTNKFGFPAAILNLFWGVLCWKRRAEEALLASGLPYTIVRPGGMERPTDSFKETHNLTLSEDDTLFGGLVSNLQVAELLAFMAKNPQISYCKIVEAIAETTAPLTSMEELLSKIPSKRQETPPSKVVPDSPSTVEKPDQVKAAAKTSQSPYMAYEDLKPPTSPSPSTPSFSSNDKPVSTGNAKPAVESHQKEPKAKPLSPYPMYEGMKPPTSPSPSTPSFSSNDKPVSSGNAKPPVESHLKEPKAKPLSPFPMYEDLKPPSSPSPSSPKC